MAVRLPGRNTAQVRGDPPGAAELRGKQFTEPLVLTAGDVIILRDPGEITARGGSGDLPVRYVDAREEFLELSDAEDEAPDIIIGGRIDLDDGGRAALLEALPRVVVLKADSPAAAPARQILQRLVEEVRTLQMGLRVRRRPLRANFRPGRDARMRGRGRVAARVAAPAGR